jgi:hypothetical protein
MPWGKQCLTPISAAIEEEIKLFYNDREPKGYSNQ